MGVFTHVVWSYTVTLLFDEQQRPDRFVVHGARDVASEGVSAAALAAAIERAVAAGPLWTASTHVFPSLAL